MNRVSRKCAEGESPRERIVNAARRLFGLKGFCATTTAELAVEAAVSIGQIYRLFTGKDDIILAIVEENVRVRVAGMYSIFDAVERGDLAMFDAIKAISDRKSVVEGKSVSVRVDLGGRRIIKKKNTLKS